MSSKISLSASTLTKHLVCDKINLGTLYVESAMTCKSENSDCSVDVHGLELFCGVLRAAVRNALMRRTWVTELLVGGMG